MEPGGAGLVFPRQQLCAGGGKFLAAADLTCHAVEPWPSGFLLDYNHYNPGYITTMNTVDIFIITIYS